MKSENSNPDNIKFGMEIQNAKAANSFSFKAFYSSPIPTEVTIVFNPDGNTEQSDFDDLYYAVKVNELGMVSIPKTIRAELNIEPKQPITILMDDNAVILLKGENVYGYDDCEQWVRHVDEFGRVAIPIEIRKALEIESLRELPMYCNIDNEIVIETPTNHFF